MVLLLYFWSSTITLGALSGGGTFHKISVSDLRFDSSRGRRLTRDLTFAFAADLFTFVRIYPLFGMPSPYGRSPAQMATRGWSFVSGDRLFACVCVAVWLRRCFHILSATKEVLRMFPGHVRAP